MNILELAQQIESDYGVIIGRADLSQPLSDKNLPATDSQYAIRIPIIDGCNEGRDLRAGINRQCFQGYVEYNGGVREVINIPFTVFSSDENTALLTQSAVDKLLELNSVACVTSDIDKTPVLSNCTVEAVELKQIAVIKNPIGPVEKVV
jgi:hypothetical protein